METNLSARRLGDVLLLLFPVFLISIFLGSALAGAAPSPPARLTYTKTLKGSVPEYVAITVDASGEGTYDGRKLNEPPHPRKMKLSPATTQKLFGLAQALGDFRSVELESHKKVANLGLKTFAYQKGGQTDKVQFNYTLNRQAQALTDLFERISNLEQHIGALEYSARYDPLGLPHELLLIEIDLDNHALTDPELMTPILDLIVKNSRFMHLAQERAQNILNRIQNN